MDHDRPELRAQVKQLLYPARNPDTGELVDFTPDCDELDAQPPARPEQAALGLAVREERW